MSRVGYCIGCYSCVEPCNLNKGKDIMIIKTGSKIKYQGMQGIVTAMWFDMTEQRVEVQLGRHKAIWTVTLKTLLKNNPKYSLSVVK